MFFTFSALVLFSWTYSLLELLHRWQSWNADLYIMIYLYYFMKKRKLSWVEWGRHIPGSFTPLLFYCSWHILEKSANTLHLGQFTLLEARLQRLLSYVINRKTHDGTGHTTQVSRPPARCLSHLFTSPPFSYIFKNTGNRGRHNKDPSKADIPCMSNEGQKYQNPAFHNQ